MWEAERDDGHGMALHVQLQDSKRRETAFAYNNETQTHTHTHTNSSHTAHAVTVHSSHFSLFRSTRLELFMTVANGSGSGLKK